jgi:hypothetical protein
MGALQIYRSWVDFYHYNVGFEFIFVVRIGVSFCTPYNKNFQEYDLILKILKNENFSIESFIKFGIEFIVKQELVYIFFFVNFIFILLNGER